MCSCPQCNPNPSGGNSTVANLGEPITVEQIREITCPRCHAGPGEHCRRRGRHGRQGRSHQERMWLRQGHDKSAFPALRARQRGGSPRDAAR